MTFFNFTNLQIVSPIPLNISFDFSFIPLLVIIAIAWFIPMSMSLLKIRKVPTVIVEIIAGYIVGQALMPYFDKESFVNIEFLALSGFLFLMFQSGLEIDTKKIIATFPKRKITASRFFSNPLLVGLTIFIITLSIAYFSSFLLSKYIKINNVWYFSLILVPSSVGIIVQVLKGRGETNNRFGQMVVIAAAVADIFSIILFTFTAFVIKHGFEPKLILILLPFVMFILFYKAGQKLNKTQVFKSLIYQLGHATSQIKVRGTFLVILIFLVLAQYLGEEVTLLGAFLSGLLMSFFIPKNRSLLILQLDGISYGFFIPIFFIMVGMKFDPSTLNEFNHSYIYILLLILAILFLVKIIPSLIWIRLFGLRKALSGGILIASRLSLIITAAKIGLDLNIISPGMNASVIIMAVITCFSSPILYNFLNPQKAIQGEKTIIVGGGEVGVLLAERLKMHGKTAIIIENNLQRYRELKADGMNVELGDGAKTFVFKELNMRPNDYVIVLTGDDSQNHKICKHLKEIGHERIITNAKNPEIEEKIRLMDIHSLDHTRIIATTIENYIIRPTTYHALVETFETFIIEEIKVINKEIDGMLIKNFPVPKDSYLMLIKRGDEMYIPHGDSDLRAGDIVTAFGTESALNRIRQQLFI